tara:strand:+ start:4195 stop:4902 length:708 start_codon:yes stop_codon:yes gene_type:complete
MPSVLPMDMMSPMPSTEEELVQEIPPEPVDENEIFSKKEAKKNTSSEKEIEKIEKQETKAELELLIVEQNEKPKKKKRGKSTKSPEELAAHMAKMRAASLKKRQEKKKQKDLLKKETLQEPIESLPEKPKLETIPEKPRISEQKPEQPKILKQKSEKHSISIEDKLRLTELKLFEYQIREDERNKIKGKNENKAKEIAKKNIQQPNRWGRKSAIANWAQMPTYQSDDPYDVFKIK